LKTRSLLVAAAIAAAIPLPVAAHAFLESASPAAGESVAAGPAKVELHFTESLENSFSGVSVFDAAGHDMATGPSAAHGAEMELPLKKLAPGTYRVSWHAVSVDTHRTEGKYEFVVLSGAAATAPPASAPLLVTEAWIRALPAGLPDGGYFTLKNPTAKTVTLTGAASPACGMLMLHRSETMSGMSSMSDVVSIDVPAGATVKFAPGGYHLMCMNPASAIKPGGRIKVELEFAGGATVPVEFAVRGANGH